jgi:hypothetical protein
MPLSKDDAESCKSLLRECEMFQKVPPHLIDTLADTMRVRNMKKREKFIHQGEPTDAFYLLESGQIKRKFVDPQDGRVHKVEFAIKAKSINSMRVISGEPAFSSVKCVSDSCKTYEMKRDDFLKLLKTKPDLGTYIAEGLCEQLRIGSKKYATPLLEQRQEHDINVPAVTIAAGIESYYRSALNAVLNSRLTGVMGELFPNMHIQVPTRVTYILGFKGIRAALDKNIEPEQYDYPNAIRLAATVAPGVIMTPISSILEASNAGHMNSEPMITRWMRGVVPRAGREIIFGVGLNQMSDYFQERFQPYFRDNAVMGNAAGSLAAGVVSGYLSHVPHNISTFKLLEPQRSYVDLYTMFVDKSVPPTIDQWVESWSPNVRSFTRTLFATLFPKGLIVRTTQIVGSFIILNGTINYFELREHTKIQAAVAATSSIPY